MARMGSGQDLPAPLSRLVVHSTKKRRILLGGSVISGFVFLLGLGGIPGDIATWAGWLRWLSGQRSHWIILGCAAAVWVLVTLWLVLSVRRAHLPTKEAQPRLRGKELDSAIDAVLRENAPPPPLLPPVAGGARQAVLDRLTTQSPKGIADRLADLLRSAYSARDRVQNTTDRDAILDACQSFLTIELEAENLVKAKATEYAADFQQASRPPSASMNRAEILNLMDKRIRVHSEIIGKIRAEGQRNAVPPSTVQEVSSLASSDWCDETAALKSRGEGLLKQLRGHKAAEPFGGVVRLARLAALPLAVNAWLGDVAAFVFREAPEADYATEVVKEPPRSLDALIEAVRQDLIVLTHMRVEAGCQTIADEY
jgi:hypothetical protein